MHDWLGIEFSLDIFIGLVVGLAFGGLIILISRLIKKPEKFDERQIAARGRAYKISLVTLVGYLTACLLCWNLNLEWARFDIQIYLGLILAFAVFEFIVIYSGAYFGFNRSIKYKRFCVIIFYLGSAFVFIESLLLHFLHGFPFIYKGLLTVLTLLIAFGPVCAAIATAMVIKLAKDKKENC